jgi:Uma2 family endonuclease
MDQPQDRPPPDLALEIDITNSSLNRIAIYASLAVPEVWHFDGRDLACKLLQSGGGYVASPTSQAFTGLEVGELVRFLKLRRQMDENSIAREFRAWARQTMGGTGKTLGPGP